MKIKLYRQYDHRVGGWPIIQCSENPEVCTTQLGFFLWAHTESYESACQAFQEMCEFVARQAKLCPFGGKHSLADCTCDPHREQ